jgi:hypothetical protein
MESQQRRRFDHFAAELSVAVGVRVPRHALWLAAAGHLESAGELTRFCEQALAPLLREWRIAAPAPREAARLRRELARFDPARRSPEEIIGALFAGVGTN